MYRYHRRCSAELPFRCMTWMAGCLTLYGIAGCLHPSAQTPNSTTTLTVEAIINRCAQNYQEVTTLEARGLLRDYRDDQRKVIPFRWDYSRPDRCRFQLGKDLTLVVGNNWWTYDSRRDRFKTLRQISRTPIRTAAYFLSDGISFLLPAVLDRGRAAFESESVHGSDLWNLDGTAWIVRRPCYSLSRILHGRDGRHRWTVWIDQDTFLIRGWTLDLMRSGSDDRTVLGCTYYEVILNKPMASDRFQLQRPSPITLPGKQAS